MIATGLNSMSRGPDVVRVSQRDIEAALKAATERWKPGLLDLSHAIHADPGSAAGSFAPPSASGGCSIGLASASLIASHCRPPR